MDLDTEYDLIVLGTGFVESVLAGYVRYSLSIILYSSLSILYSSYQSFFINHSLSIILYQPFSIPFSIHSNELNHRLYQISFTIFKYSYISTSISRAVAREGKKVLHLDHNDYYGGYNSSWNLAGFETLLTSTTEGKQIEKNSNKYEFSI